MKLLKDSIPVFPVKYKCMFITCNFAAIVESEQVPQDSSGLNGGQLRQDQEAVVDNIATKYLKCLGGVALFLQEQVWSWETLLQPFLQRDV